MFWMCNDQTVINLDHVVTFFKENAISKQDSPRIEFRFRNTVLSDLYDTIEERDFAFDTLIKELGTVI